VINPRIATPQAQPPGRRNNFRHCASVNGSSICKKVVPAVSSRGGRAPVRGHQGPADYTRHSFVERSTSAPEQRSTGQSTTSNAAAGGPDPAGPPRSLPLALSISSDSAPQRTNARFDTPHQYQQLGALDLPGLLRRASRGRQVQVIAGIHFFLKYKDQIWATGGRVSQ
jgi:hypothetical protein